MQHFCGGVVLGSVVNQDGGENNDISMVFLVQAWCDPQGFTGFTQGAEGDSLQWCQEQGL